MFLSIQNDPKVDEMGVMSNIKVNSSKEFKLSTLPLNAIIHISIKE
jgi:hypothetical protein